MRPSDDEPRALMVTFPPMPVSDLLLHYARRLASGFAERGILVRRVVVRTAKSDPGAVRITLAGRARGSDRDVFAEAHGDPFVAMRDAFEALARRSSGSATT